VSSLPPIVEPIRNCHNCGQSVPLGALDCAQCHALLHSEELVRISTKANQLEEQNALPQARDEWRKALALLPHNSNQAEWIRGKIYKLELTEKHAPASPPKSEWAKRLGPLAPIVVVLAKSKGLLLALFKLKFLFSFFTFLIIYWKRYGFGFGVGFVVLLLVHELGHYIDIRRRGLPADMPVFLPGLGAYVRWQTMGVTRQTRAAVSLAGPLAGLLGAAVCAYLWRTTGNGLWAVLARVSAALNLLNLTPVWILDGGQAANALSKAERFVLLALTLILWAYLGQVVFFAVAAGITYRLFTKDLPPIPNPRIAAYYASLLIGLGAILYIIPGQGLPPR
jgi:Zn-dependent protease